MILFPGVIEQFQTKYIWRGLIQIILVLIYGVVNSDCTLVLNTQQMFVVTISNWNIQAVEARGKINLMISERH